MDLTVFQGRAARYLIGQITIPGTATPYPLVSVRLRLMVKDRMTDPDGQALIHYAVTFDGSGTPSGDTANLYLGQPDPANPAVQINATPQEAYVTVEFSADDTAPIGPGKKQWEIVMVDANNRPHQLRAGSFTVLDTLIDVA